MNRSRRRFLLQLSLAGSALLLAPALSSADDAPAPNGWVVVGKASSFVKGAAPTAVTLPASAGGLTLFVARGTDDGLRALSSLCTHRGCAVDWQAGDQAYLCPCHRGRFDATGQVMGSLPRRPLPSYPTRTNTDGTVSVQIPAA